LVPIEDSRKCSRNPSNSNLHTSLSPNAKRLPTQFSEEIKNVFNTLSPNAKRNPNLIDDYKNTAAIFRDSYLPNIV